MGRVLKATYDELFMVVFLSIVWWVGTVLIITAAPTMIGVSRVANRLANYRRVDSSFFWEAARSNFWRSWPIYLITVVVPIALAINIAFYSRLEGLWWAFAVFWLWAFVFSLLAAQYTFALYWQQDEPGLLLILRNAFLLAVRHPLYSFLMLIFHLTLIIIGAVLALPLFLLVPGMLALSANFATTGLLQEMDLAPQPPEIPTR